MSIEFWDSFDTYTDPLTWWTSRSSTSAAISSGNGRFGTNSMRVSGSNNAVWISKTLTSVQTRIIAFSYKTNDLPNAVISHVDIVDFFDATTFQIGLFIKPNGQLRVIRGSTVLGDSTFSLQPNQTYHIQFKVKIHSSTGTVDVKVNNVSVISLTGQNTQVTANATCDSFSLGPRQIGGYINNYNVDYDDLVVLNDSGAVNNDFPGDARVQSTLPTGAGTTTQWTPSTGSNYQNVDDNPPNDDTDYNSSATSGQYDTYAMGDIAATSGTVLAVAARMRARKDDAGTRTIAGAIRTNSNDYFGASQNIGTTYMYYAELWETNPNTAAAFTIGEVDAIEAGIKLIA